MTTISMDTNIYGMALEVEQYIAVHKGLKMLNFRDKYVSDIWEQALLRKR